MNPRRILVIHVTRIGDTLLTTAVLRALAAAWPAARICFAGHRKRIEVMRYLPFVNSLRSISKRTAPLLGRLTGERFDLALVYGNDSTLVDYALRVADKVIAQRQQSDAINRRLFAIACEDGYRPVHAVSGLLTMIRPLGIEPAGFELTYRVTDAENSWATAAIRSRCIDGAPLIGLQLASFPTKAYRDWPIEHFIGLCERIVAAHPAAQFLIFGGTAEADRTERLRHHFLGRTTSFAGRLSLRKTAALMNHLDLYIGVDTGPTHIMGALHRPMVSLYHPTAPSRALAPLGHPCCVAVDHPLADKGASFDTPMADISVDMMWQHVSDALAGRFQAPRSTPWSPALAARADDRAAPGVPRVYH